jgi:hypothetical protein
MVWVYLIDFLFREYLTKNKFMEQNSIWESNRRKYT